MQSTDRPLEIWRRDATDDLYIYIHITLDPALLALPGPAATPIPAPVVAAAAPIAGPVLASENPAVDPVMGGSFEQNGKPRIRANRRADGAIRTPSHPDYVPLDVARSQLGD